ncbi:MAG: ribose 5-phosphate isomerase B [Tannerella sp.]|jgi:ribose 5-phosphate isomerase B|nr:ribose 5-phosphate isomerase B [Tannerella sp.]
MKTIGLASDHAGFELKEFAKKYVETKEGYACKDFGAYSAESVDYPDYAHPLAEAVESGAVDSGIALCGSGNGISITLNKHRGIRAAICWTAELSGLARAHNDANVLVLPARFISRDETGDIIDMFLTTPFSSGRHQQRIEKIPVPTG